MTPLHEVSKIAGLFSFEKSADENGAARRVFYFVGFILAALGARTLPGQQPAAKSPVPDSAAQAEATKLVKEVYGRQVTAAKSAERKKVLAELLFQAAKESGNDRATQFVLLRLAKDIAVQAADCQMAFAAVEETDRAFQIDPLEMKADVLRRCSSSATTVEQCATIAENADQVFEDALAKNNFNLARSVIEQAIGEAKKAKDESLARQYSVRKTEINGIAQAYVVVQAAMATLEKTSTDPEANLAVGKYDCFEKGDWEHGLPRLALGNDDALKALGEAEVNGAASSEEQAKLGDAWWKAAETAKGMEKKRMEVRAGYWYQNALPALSGLPKDKVASRLQKLQEILPIYLSDLPAVEVQVHDRDQNVPTETSFRGRSSSHTLWAHPPEKNSSSHLAYQLNNRFKTFHGDVGISSGNSHPADTPLIFRIVADGKTLWRSVPLRQPNASASFHVNVAKVVKLELFVDCPGPHAGAWALWIDPILEH